MARFVLLFWLRCLKTSFSVSYPRISSTKFWTCQKYALLLPNELRHCSERKWRCMFLYTSNNWSKTTRWRDCGFHPFVLTNHTNIIQLLFHLEFISIPQHKISQKINAPLFCNNPLASTPSGSECLTFTAWRISPVIFYMKRNCIQNHFGTNPQKSLNKGKSLRFLVYRVYCQGLFSSVKTVSFTKGCRPINTSFFTE